MSNLLNAIRTTFSSFSALNTSISTTSDNIANANNDSYHRRVESYEDLRYGGVKVTDIIRLADEGMQRNYLTSINLNGSDEAVRNVYDQLEQLVGGGTSRNYLTEAVQAFSDAWKAFEAAPENYAAEQDVITKARSMTDELTRISAGMSDIAIQVRYDVDDEVAKVNQLLSDVDSLNNDIVKAKAKNLDISGFQNTRDAKLEQLSEYIDIKTYNQSNGAVSVYSSNGLSMVDDVAHSFTFDFDNMALTISNQSNNLLGTNQMPTGKLAANINLIRTDSDAVNSTDYGMAAFQKLYNQLDELAYSFVDDATAALQGGVGVEADQELTTVAGLEVGESFSIQTTYNQTTVDATTGESTTSEVQGTLQTITITEGMTAQDLVDTINNLTFAADEPTLRARLTSSGILEIATTSQDVVNINFADVNTQEEGAILAEDGTVLVDGSGNLAVSVTNVGGIYYYNGVPLTDTFTVENSTGVLAALGMVSSSSQTSTTVYLRDPPTFSNAYDNATMLDGESSVFFDKSSGSPIGIDRNSLTVTSTLLAGTERLKHLAGNDVVTALNDHSRQIIGSGDIITAQSYVGLASTILTNMTSRANDATLQADTTESLKNSFYTQLRDKVGVDIDEEMMRLTVLQNSYSATARAMSTIQKMFDALEQAV